MDNYKSNMLENVIETKRICDSICEDEQNEEYKNLMKIINYFLLKYCSHELVYDTIDIDPERSENICYCKICNITMS